MSAAVVSIPASRDCLFASTIILVTTALLIRTYTVHHGPLPGGGIAIKWNSYFYSFVSFLLLALILCSTKLGQEQLPRSHLPTAQTGENIIRARGSTTVTWVELAYHLSKFYEYVDIFLVLAIHGTQSLVEHSTVYPSIQKSTRRTVYTNPIDLHFAIHHLTTPYFTYYRVLGDECDGWEYFAALNTFHHVVMYAYFGGAFSSQLLQRSIRRLLPWSGYTQLIVGIGVELQIVYGSSKFKDVRNSKCDGFGHYVALTLLSIYLMLFTRELSMKSRDAEATQGVEEKSD